MSEIFLGRLVKAFGIRGELKFHPSEDFWEPVLTSTHLMMASESEGGTVKRGIVLERSRTHGNSYVIKIDGVDDRNTAETLVGAEVFVDEEALDVDLPEELLPYQVIGMKVVSEEGDVLGEVTSVLHSAAHDLYEVAAAGNEFLVPAVPEFVRDVDIGKRRMTVRVLPGLMGD